MTEIKTGNYYMCLKDKRGYDSFTKGKIYVSLYDNALINDNHIEVKVMPSDCFRIATDDEIKAQIRAQDKQLLLQDLCTRLPYGVKVWYKYYSDNVTSKFATSIRLVDGKIALSSKFNREGDWYPVEEANELLIKPYLRPISSMTEEEARELAALHDIKEYIWSVKVTNVYIDYTVDDGFGSTEIRTIWHDELISSVECLDWLNSKHFDYRRLILKGLAIAVTDENNPYK